MLRQCAVNRLLVGGPLDGHVRTVPVEATMIVIAEIRPDDERIFEWTYGVRRWKRTEHSPGVTVFECDAIPDQVADHIDRMTREASGK